jgi:hypothetical protein
MTRTAFDRNSQRFLFRTPLVNVQVLKVTPHTEYVKVNQSLQISRHFSRAANVVEPFHLTHNLNIASRSKFYCIILVANGSFVLVIFIFLQ